MSAWRGAVLAALWGLSLGSRADERILDFASDVRVGTDGAMQVEETIRVRAEGAEIRHGIYRDFPTDYRDRLGNRYRVGFEVIAARRDGMPEPWREQRIGNGVRVYLGSAERLVSRGEHQYVLEFRTNRQLGFFEDHDELYWNVTGNGWIFPIDAASARVTLPARPGFALAAVECYTGRMGSTERACEARAVTAASALVRSSRSLAPREGLTVVATWPKGWIAPPTLAQRVGWLLAQNAGLEAALAAFLATLLYLTFAWYKAGRDPEPGVVFPQYSPPGRFSPASLRYIARMRYDRKAFAAAILGLAVKGYVEIDESGRTYTLQRRQGGQAVLAAGEQALLEELFSKGERVVLENENHAILSRTMQAHRKSLRRHYNRVYFLTNATFLIPAALVLAAALAAVVLIGQFSWAVAAVLALSFLTIPVFAFLLKAPTRSGRRLLDDIEGFKLYLDVAERDELNLRNPPEKTPELFEAYLPFALALGVEQRWAEKFARVFARLQQETGVAYSPGWYHGRWSSAMIAGDLGRFTADMTRSLGNAIASASTPPGSSSGAGGGGVSGGGGGGGGGGGW